MDSIDSRELIIVSLTTWEKRIQNIPTVLDTIFSQTKLPDLVVLNVADSLQIPQEILLYLEQHSVEINRVCDTKVYKKFLPTITKYPNAAIIAIDDDILYPIYMIEDFCFLHEKYPHFPISGANKFFFGMQHHCGCASLVKAEYYGDYLNEIDSDLMDNCHSSDIVYTLLANLNGYPYIHTIKDYYNNIASFNPVASYTENYVNSVGGGIGMSFNYLVKRFGYPSSIDKYIEDEYIRSILINALDSRILYENETNGYIIENRIRKTKAFRIGYSLLKPIKYIKAVIKKIHRQDGDNLRKGA